MTLELTQTKHNILTTDAVLLENLKERLQTNEYAFLREYENLNSRIALLAIGGSIAYGTNHADSDTDLRGFALERPEDLIGFSTFKQVIHAETDTTIYSFNKMVNLLMDMNPNVVEIIGCRPEHYVYKSPVGQALLDNKQMFVSQHCIDPFIGMAGQNLTRLTNALARDRVSQSKKEEHIKESIERAMTSFKDRYTLFNEGFMLLSTDVSAKEKFDTEIFIDMSLSHYPLRDLTGILSETLEIVKNYNKINHRNKKKDDKHVNKHAMHTQRVIKMGCDLLETGKINTHRGGIDLDELLFTLNGGYMLADGSFSDDYFVEIEKLKKRFAYAKANTVLPLHPDYKMIEEFKMDINRKIINGTY